MKKALAVLGLFLVAVNVYAYYSPGDPTGYVNDYAGVLSQSEHQNLEQKLKEFEKETTNEIAVVTISSLKGDTIENFAVQLFEEWGIGKKGKDNGVLLLVAMNEKQVRLEVGYGLESSLTDAQSYWIINNVITPSFKKGDYYEGVDGAVDMMIGATKGENVASSKPDDVPPLLLVLLFGGLPFLWLWGIIARTKSWWLGGLIGTLWGLIITLVYGFWFYGFLGFLFFIPFGLLIDYLVSRGYKKGKRKGHIPWYVGGSSFGGGGGGFSGFGGGSSGGGGASGGW